MRTVLYRVFPGGKAAGGVVLTIQPPSKRRGHERLEITSIHPLGLRGLL